MHIFNISLSLLILANSCNSSYAATRNNPTPIRTITISCDDWPGSCNKDGSGLYFEILRAIYGLDGIRVEHRIDPFIRSFQLIQSHQIDGMACAQKSPEREQYFLSPKIRFTTVYASLLHREKANLKKPIKLSGRVNIIRGYNYAKYLNQDAQLTELTRASQGAQMVLSGRSEYFINPFYDTYMAIKILMASDKTIHPSKFNLSIIESSPNYIFFQKNERGQQLANIYDKNFETLYKNGTISNIIKKYPLGGLYDFYPEINKLAEQPKPPNNIRLFSETWR